MDKGECEKSGAISRMGGLLLFDVILTRREVDVDILRDCIVDWRDSERVCSASMPGNSVVETGSDVRFASAGDVLIAGKLVGSSLRDLWWRIGKSDV